MVNTAIFLLYLNLLSSTEAKNRLDFLSETNPIIKKEYDLRSRSFLTLKETSELKLAFSGLIRFYQLYISSQDVPSCNFTLTCSRFTTKAIREYGAFHGILMGSDRIQRCFGPSRKYYPIDPRTGYAIDYPVEAYYIGRKKSQSPLPKHICPLKRTYCHPKE